MLNKSIIVCYLVGLGSLGSGHSEVIFCTLGPNQPAVTHAYYYPFAWESYVGLTKRFIDKYGIDVAKRLPNAGRTISKSIRNARQGVAFRKAFVRLHLLFDDGSEVWVDQKGNVATLTGIRRLSDAEFSRIRRIFKPKWYVDGTAAEWAKEHGQKPHKHH